MKKTVMLLKVADRTAAAVKVQELLTKHGCSIRTRLGLHSTASTCSGPVCSCSDEGLIFLELENAKAGQALAADLRKVKGVVSKLVTL